MTFKSDNATPHSSSEYDRAVRQTIPYYEIIQTETINLIKILKPDVKCWLDTGCGTGYLIEKALPYFPETNFVLTDPSAPMLEQAKHRLNGIPEQRVRFLPPIPSDGLIEYKKEIHPQVITAILCHHYLRKAQHLQTTQVCYDLLDKDGVFITFENTKPVNEINITVALERWKHFQIEQGRPEAVVEEHLKRFNTHYFPISIEEHLSLLNEVGFKSVALFWLSYLQAGFYAVK